MLQKFPRRPGRWSRIWTTCTSRAQAVPQVGDEGSTSGDETNDAQRLYTLMGCHELPIVSPCSVALVNVLEVLHGRKFLH